MSRSSFDAVVVGSGPNGLAGAVRLAQAGLAVLVLEGAETIGGGTRTQELTLPGLRHDVCSAVHPFGVASPYLSSLPLQDFGLVWRWPEIDLVHPLEDGSAGVFHRSIEETAAGLGADGSRWLRLFGPLARHFDDLAVDVLGPLLRRPAHPVRLAQFGIRGALPATSLARSLRSEQARGLFGGCAAHIFRPLTGPATASAGALLVASGHRYGWPVAEGGSAAVTTALARMLQSLGGEIRTGVTVTGLADLPDADIALFDTSPTGLMSIAGDRLPPRVRRGLGRWRYGPAAFKLDLAVRGGIPWTAEAARRAGTVHVGGTLREIAEAEAEVARGRLPERPFVLVGQQYLADPSRSVGDVHPVWVYAHVPHGSTADATEVVMGQLDRFAPGIGEHVVASHAMAPGDFERYNPNYVGGDIATGASSLRQLVARPRLSARPYATGIKGVYLCSAATPPGAGVHGMAGFHAAEAALADLVR